jgi:membrane protein DedA with SNARE-associated domain
MSDTSASSAASVLAPAAGRERYTDKLFLWVDVLSIIAWFPATDAGLAEAKQVMVQQWQAASVKHRVAAPVADLVNAIAALKALFFIRRVAPVAGDADEVGCTLQTALDEVQQM